MPADLAADARAVFHAAVRAVRAETLLGGLAAADLFERPLSSYRRVLVAGMGKAALAMGTVTADRLGGRMDAGVVVVPHGYAAHRPAGALPVPASLRVLEAGHPVPDRASELAATALLELVEGAEADDLVVALVSGGGTALAMRPVRGVSVPEAGETVRLLLESGADIHAMNTVRRCLSRVGGGGLARAAYPAEVSALVVSDVVGDDPGVIASGPTAPDAAPRADAADVLRAYDLWARAPASVRAYLTAADDEVQAADDVFARVRTRLVGSNRDALAAAWAEAQARGYAVYKTDDALTGEARVVGRRLAEETLALGAGRPVCLLWGGETTVTVRGRGRGGRNQEVALAASLVFEGTGRDVCLLSGGTDGRDGPTPAAGAWATADTAAAARRRGLSPETYLARNDAYAFFREAGGLLRTGPTHTNVMDVVVALVR